MIQIYTLDKCYLLNPTHIVLVEIENLRSVVFITLTTGRQIKIIRNDDELCGNGLKSPDFDLLLDELEAL